MRVSSSWTVLVEVSDRSVSTNEVWGLPLFAKPWVGVQVTVRCAGEDLSLKTCPASFSLLDLIGPRNLFRDLCFRSRPSVRPYVRPYVRTSVRPYGIYFLTARRIFLLFFLMDLSWEGAKTYRARFLNFLFFAPVKVQKHLFFVLFFKFLKNREVKFFYFLIFYSSRRAGHFCFLVRDRSVETSP